MGRGGVAPAPNQQNWKNCGAKGAEMFFLFKTGPENTQTQLIIPAVYRPAAHVLLGALLG